MSNPTGSAKIRSLVTMIYRYRVQSNKSLIQDQGNRTQFSSPCRFTFSSFIRTAATGNTKSAAEHIAANDEKNIATPKLVSPAKPSFPSWVKWILGSLLTLVLPFWKQKWAHLLVLGGTVEKVVDEVEMVAEVVEKVATTAEKVAADVANNSPESGIIKEAAIVVEHISSEFAEDTKVTQDVIRKVDELEHDLTDLGKLVKPIIDEIIENKDVPN